MKPRTKTSGVDRRGRRRRSASPSALVLNAFQSNLVFFFTPTQVASNEAPRDRAFRIGGLVEAGSVVRDKRRRSPCASA